MRSVLENIRVKIHISDPNDPEQPQVSKDFDAKLTHDFCGNTPFVIPSTMKTSGSRQV